jgi:uncharacterized small protein (DUF1192 family)
MDEEDDLKRNKAKSFEPKMFDAFSVDELNTYIAELKAEIARAEAAIEAKRGFRSSAEDVFRR